MIEPELGSKDHKHRSGFVRSSKTDRKPVQNAIPRSTLAFLLGRVCDGEVQDLALIMFAQQHVGKPCKHRKRNKCKKGEPWIQSIGNPTRQRDQRSKPKGRQEREPWLQRDRKR